MPNLPNVSDDRLLDPLCRLSSAYDRLGVAFARKHTIHPTDLHALQLMAAHERADERVTAGGLAGEMGLSSGAVTYLVERLSQSGHVERAVDPHDRRRALLSCTASGHQVLQAFGAPLGAAVEHCIGGLDDATIQRLAAALSTLADALAGQAAGLDAQPSRATA